MASNLIPRKGYVAFTVILSVTAQRLIDLVSTQLGYTLAGAFREIQIQVDPEGTAGSVRVGDATLGTLVPAVTGQVQKGVTLAASASDTYRAGNLNDVYFLSLYVQAVTGTPSINVQLWEM